MHFRPSQPVNRPVTIALSLFALAFALAILTAATADAAYYKTLYCGAADGSGDPVKGARPGFFDFTDDCGTAYGDPAGTGGFLRLEENTTGTAGNTDEASYSWWPPSGVSIAAVSVWTRVPGYFNSGWRSRFWAEGYDGSQNNILMQGSGVANDGIYAPATSNFGYHAWPFGGYGDYKRLVFAMTCYRPAGCSREGWNAADANSIAITLNDKESPHVNWEGDSHVLAGDWVRGNNAIAWRESDQGSGLRFSRLKVDGATLSDGTIDYQANGGCRTGHSDANGEFARDFTPCTAGPYLRYYPLRTEWFSDGAHQLATCVQDFAQYQHLGGSASESCDSRTIHTDNTAPGKVAALEVTSANPARYLRHFGARFSLPPDPGSPIAAVHFQVLNGKGEVVVPERTVAATDPTSLADIEGPAEPGAYRLKLWLTDSVGYSGPAAEAPIPHDTTPPPAPQDLGVAGAATHWLDKLNLRWANIVDAGSPIDTARFQLLDPAGNPLGAAQVLRADNVQAIDGIDTPAQRCACAVRVWLADAEGNVGAPSSVELPRDTTPPAAPQRLQLAAPDTPRSRDGFDLHWTDIGDDGSPVDGAHYEVLDGSGHVAVPEQTVRGKDVSAIADVHAPDSAGSYTLRLWLSDAEGNAGAPASVPLAYECSRSPVPGGANLDAALSEGTVQQGQSAALSGALRQSSGAPVAGAPLCVFEQVEGEDARHYLGLAYTDAAGRYRFAVSPGPNRALRTVYRPGNRRLSAQADLKTRVKPTLRARKSVIHNGQVAHLEGQIPGPRNDDVVIVLQVRQGKGWLAFRRYRTRGGGRYEAAYPFHRTTRPTTYEFRAQLRESGGYPYMEGDSDPVALKVLPKAKHRRCAKGRHLAKRHGKARCALPRASAAKRCARARRALRRRPTAKAPRRRVHRLCARAHRKRNARHARRRAG
ncbi:MAG TPA: carboxypeptidase-like regulatory domain-containing protein [Solirubrobacterales bacterium]|nr:carboxypeptidase-like regulatory domain-containing protein [Solirubrobacterales bacterium]